MGLRFECSRFCFRLSSRLSTAKSQEEPVRGQMGPAVCSQAASREAAWERTPGKGQGPFHPSSFSHFSSQTPRNDRMGGVGGHAAAPSQAASREAASERADGSIGPPPGTFPSSSDLYRSYFPTCAPYRIFVALHIVPNFYCVFARCLLRCAVFLLYFCFAREQDGQICHRDAQWLLPRQLPRKPPGKGSPLFLLRPFLACFYLGSFCISLLSSL